MYVGERRFSHAQSGFERLLRIFSRAAISSANELMEANVNERKSLLDNSFILLCSTWPEPTSDGGSRGA